MSDTAHDEIYQVAEQQAGYFTVGQAAAAGMAMRTLRYHARPGGRFERVRRGEVLEWPIRHDWKSFERAKPLLPASVARHSS